MRNKLQGISRVREKVSILNNKQNFVYSCTGLSEIIVEDGNGMVYGGVPAKMIRVSYVAAFAIARLTAVRIWNFHRFTIFSRIELPVNVSYDPHVHCYFMITNNCIIFKELQISVFSMIQFNRLSIFSLIYMTLIPWLGNNIYATCIDYQTIIVIYLHGFLIRKYSDRNIIVQENIFFYLYQSYLISYNNIFNKYLLNCIKCPVIKSHPRELMMKPAN